MSEPEAIAAEYEAARTAAAVVGLPDRAVLAVRGPKHVAFLQSILSNDLANLTPGQGCRAALMDAKGHLQCLVRALVGQDEVALEIPAHRLEPVEKLLVHYRVAAPVRFHARPTTVLALLGPGTREVLATAGLPVPVLALEQHVSGTIGDTTVAAARAGDLPADGFVLHAPSESEATLRQALLAAGARALGPPTLDALRIEDGRPWYGIDVTEAHLLHETGLVREYHSPTKGCYVGQEVVARLEARGGHVNKLLRGLRLQDPARAGDIVSAEGREVGQITTAAVSPRLGPIAMGYLHRSRFEPGTAVEVNGTAATVTSLPMTSS